MMKTWRYALSVLSICGAVMMATPVDAQSGRTAGQRIQFNQYPTGVMANAVTKAWESEEKYAEYIQGVGTVPDFAMGQYDLNGDGRPEIFARHTDDLSGFCHTPELMDVLCLMAVYANTDKGLIKIGEMPAGDEVIVGTRINKGVRDIIITQPGGRKTYVWNGKGFEAE